MSKIFSFPPISRGDAHTLILGSMPGGSSLRAEQYYAHPRNRFWPIMGALIGAHPTQPYSDRVHKLSSAGIALWDVMRCCERAGSLDSSINGDSVVTNDFEGFFADHLQIDRIFFNGITAESVFKRLVLPKLAHNNYQLQRLPSTSPANAAWSLESHLKVWQSILKGTSSPLHRSQ